MNKQRVAGAESGRRLLAVLLSFTKEQPLWTVHDLAKHLNLSHSSVYRYIALLREVGLIDSAGDTQYRVTELITSLSEAQHAADFPLNEFAPPILERLRDSLNETVLIARRVGWNVFTAHRYESRSPVRLQFDHGQPMALHKGSMSRLLLAAMTKNARTNYIAQLDAEIQALPQLTNQALETILNNGVTESLEEIDEGIWGVAAIILSNEEIIASLGCAAPIYRTNEKRRIEIREQVVNAAREISIALSPNNPPPVERWS